MAIMNVTRFASAHLPPKRPCSTNARSAPSPLVTSEALYFTKMAEKLWIFVENFDFHARLPHRQARLPRLRSNFHGKYPQISFFRACHDFSRLEAARTRHPRGIRGADRRHRLESSYAAHLSAVGPRHKTYQQDGWQIYTPRHAPPASLEGHLTFALKYEGLDLLVLKALFQATGPEPIEAMVRSTPTGTYARRSWFLYEWLLGVRIVDPDLQWTAAAVTSTRHRVKNNLPGTPSFCPMIFRTEILREFTKRNLPARAREVVADLPADVLARTAAFLLLKDSRSSFEIEGEHPPQERIQRWARAIGEAGRKPIDLDELLRLQRIVIGDDRFVLLGLRNEGGFVGDRDRDSYQRGTRSLPPHSSPSGLSISTRSRTATAGCTDI